MPRSMLTIFRFRQYFLLFTEMPELLFWEDSLFARAWTIDTINSYVQLNYLVFNEVA